MRRLFAAVLAGVVLAGCAAQQALEQQRREAVARRIVDDAIAFNEAYHEAITSQVLLNIMRAANRQPRQYMSMSGFTQNGATRDASITIGGVALDQLGEAWGAGAFGIGGSRQLEPNYTLSPFATEAFASIVMRPTDAQLFRYYWDSGWNPDLLLMVLVQRVRILPVNGGAPRDLSNSAGTITDDCAGPRGGAGCDFVLAMRELAGGLSRYERLPTPPVAPGECGPIAVYALPGSATARRASPATPASADARCPVEIVVGEQRYLMALRSLDDAVYYVGQLMRRDAQAREPAPEGEMRARLGVTAPGFPIWANERAPIFRIVAATRESERDFAATVTFAGKRYSAGAPVDRFCYEVEVENCRTGEYLDLSGTVLELLVGILAFNQSDEAVAPPQNSVFEVR
ncbi:MAG: hypothetical protein ACREH4_07610 [Vitreimonas sp.]